MTRTTVKGPGLRGKAVREKFISNIGSDKSGNVSKREIRDDLLQIQQPRLKILSGTPKFIARSMLRGGAAFHAKSSKP